MVFLLLMLCAGDPMGSMPGMQMGPRIDTASGTSVNPESWQMPMLGATRGSWMLMGMGQAFIVDTQQAGPRGGDKLYSPNWFMGSATHDVAGGSLMFETMLSLEPATVTQERYPLLFQTGETAYGKPLTDAQHPHNFVMALGAHYVHGPVHLYYAPVGDPALGPVAFPHRASASEIPQAPLGHHWEDSTHIADNVATVALRYKSVQVEASGFYGTEPGENRWKIDWGPMNSYAGRISVAPSKNWTAQVSAGRLAKPERQSDGDVVRVTASVQYSKPMAGGTAWSSSAVWGRNHDVLTHRNSDAYLLESVYPFSGRNFLTGRVEVVDKDELVAAGTPYRIQAYMGGYTRDVGNFKDVEAGLGGNVTAYAIPAAIQPLYGGHPWGANVFLRLRLRHTGS